MGQQSSQLWRQKKKKTQNFLDQLMNKIKDGCCFHFFLGKETKSKQHIRRPRKKVDWEAEFPYV